MTSTTLRCDQAIFTSTRTPMGEGYRIIAASSGLKPEEKQAITRFSPSHEALCSTAPDAMGTAFYALPGGRLCVAVSGYAGAEHTGRGGQRTYTHNLVFSAADFPWCGYNPFNIIRAMADADLLSPQLAPPQVLPEHTFAVDDVAPRHYPTSVAALLGSAGRCKVLQRLLDDGGIVVNMKEHWLELTEAMMLGVPGPLRPKVAFSAGLRFSVGRSHRLHVLADDHGAARMRVAGQRIDYLSSDDDVKNVDAPSAWIAFVERHWQRDDLASLAQRTSRAFSDAGPVGRERIARLYNVVDEMVKTDTAKIIGQAGDLLAAKPGGAEEEIRAEFVTRAGQELLERFLRGGWGQLRPLWPALVALWRRGAEGTDFAQPLIGQALRTAMRDDPIHAAEAALELVRSTPPAADSVILNTLIDEVLGRLITAAPLAIDADVNRISQLSARWRTVRPACPRVQQLQTCCRAAALR